MAAKTGDLINLSYWATSTCFNTYVDLNPVHAGVADTPEESNHTSIKRRLADAAEGRIPDHLIRLEVDDSKHKSPGIPFQLQHYVEPVDWTGRQVRQGKRGTIDDTLPPILTRLEISEDTWLTIATEFEQCFRQWVGSDIAIQTATRNVGKTRSRSPPLVAN